MASTSAFQLASMMFSLTPTVPQTSCSSRLSMVDAHAGGGAGFAVDDADFVIDKVHLAEVREGAVEGFSQGGIEGVHGAVAFGDFVADVFADAEFDGGFGLGTER